MKVKSEREVTQSCPTPSNPMDCSLPGSSVHGIFQAIVLEWGAIAFSDNASKLELQGDRKTACLKTTVEKVMATHSSTLAWKISWMEKPGRLQSMGLLGVRHD